MAVSESAVVADGMSPELNSLLACVVFFLCAGGVGTQRIVFKVDGQVGTYPLCRIHRVQQHCCCAHLKRTTIANTCCQGGHTLVPVVPCSTSLLMMKMLAQM